MWSLTLDISTQLAKLRLATIYSKQLDEVCLEFLSVEETVAPWEAAVIAGELSETEKSTRDRFVTEYLKDFDEYKAALRIGYVAAFAEEYAKKFMMEPYVQQQIEARKLELSLDDDAIERKRLYAHLWEIAKSAKSDAAKVAAIKQMSSMRGFDAPVKTTSEVTVTSPVQFYLPSNGRDEPPKGNA